ncbi:ATP-binding protein [Microbacterium azadirachtae]|uniref:ATP-binding protein n=1 Tax=Microbacterium azadirachtae TaxID=582680 RepID=UPI00088DC771|nr:ATP-binding protein [Microbacterium azadirachtae]SDL60197.1 two-component system, OmpR family, sensor histidine kinase KdpD [Microbacterium azadirachtae]SEF89108.1 two-component system, OmpR family, sensor histidine kinase KdpD [Microbacterium azadirachtae]SEF91058.1 two-component system, OmpR family, sensor histidine kinase KdpD [Microbacterium azadirachtae]
MSVSEGVSAMAERRREGGSSRGRLRVLLGAAPGVGKTYEMLGEGRRLDELGRDVVIGVVETHGRAATLAQTQGIEQVPRRIVSHRGVQLDELDLDAVLARRPELALIDEMAHTNAPGSRNAKRWQDVQELLDAGIDVITTVNVQHIESLNAVVEKITGVVQQETVPDEVIRDADEVEVVDLAPQTLRDRLSAGQVYPAERIDAALSNYFRLGNLTALRELALLWLADEVDSALRSYRSQHGIDSAWQTRERVVVALTGGPEGETLLRRGARIAARSAGGELLAVHVTTQDGLRGDRPGALTQQRGLVESLGGSYHQLVGDDVAGTLVEFAQSVDASQLVIGVSRRSRLSAALTGPGIGAEIIRRSGDIDVHIVTHSAAGRRGPLPTIRGGALGWRRQLIGFAVALIGGPLLSWLLFSLKAPGSITSDVLSYQLLVVVVALIGGLRPALFAAVLSGFTLDFLFVEPLFTVTIADPLHALALVLYVVIAVLVSIVVDQAARRARAAQRASGEAELLAAVAGNVLRGDSAPTALVARAREAFGLSGIRLLSPDGDVLAVDGEPLGGNVPGGDPEHAAHDAHGPEARTTTATAGASATADGAQPPRPPRVETVPVGTAADGRPRAILELHGGDLDAAGRRLLDAIVAQLAAAIEHTDLRETAKEAAVLAETDQVRSALLSALSHDLRRPLAAAVAAVGGLRGAHRLSAEDRAELVETADESLATLSRLVTDLLDVSRVQAGVLAVSLGRVDAGGGVVSALDELSLGPDEVELALDPALPPLRADPVLLQRVLVNLLTNAVRHSPAGDRVIVSTSRLGERAEIRVADRGEGIPEDQRESAFLPFQRHGDTDNTTGLGLGLALSRGFAEGMGGTLTAEDTPGGGLTMVVSLPLDDAGLDVSTLPDPGAEYDTLRTSHREPRSDDEGGTR